VAEFDYALLASETPYPFRFQCPQDQVSHRLLRALQATGRARVELGKRVSGFVDHGDHVTVAVEGAEPIEGEWLVGADGAKSVVRRALGLTFEGTTYVDRFLLCATDLDPTSLFSGLGPVAYVFDPQEWVILMRQPQLLRVIFRLRAEEDEAAARQEAAVRARIDGFLGRSLRYRVVSSSVYGVHQRIAERFRVGRVLLAGDAAHVNNPVGGLGMNSGIHDAWVLAEALAAADPTRIDAYAEDRRAAAIQLVQRHSDENYRQLGALEGNARVARNQSLAEAAADPVQARAFLRRASMLADAPRPVAT
jgi:3-(3-hydroxy-phenyl)propionate hydroxylase